MKNQCIILDNIFYTCFFFKFNSIHVCDLKKILYQNFRSTYEIVLSCEISKYILKTKYTYNNKYGGTSV